VSSGGGPNSEIAKLSIGIEATGVDATTQKLKGVEQQAKQTADAISAASLSGFGSMISGPGLSAPSSAASSTIKEAAQSANDLGNAIQKTANASTGLVENLKDTTRPLQQAVGLVNQFAGWTTLVVGGAWGAYEAFDALNKKLDENNQKLREAQTAYSKIDQSLIYSSEDVGAQKRLDQIDEEQNRFEDLQVAKARAGQQTFQQAQQVIDRVREEFAERRRVIKEQEQGDKEARIASANAANERKAYEEVQARISKAQNEERIAGLKDENKVIEELAQKREEINKKISEEGRESVREALFAELAATESLYDKKIKLATQERLDRERKEQELKDKQAQQEAERVRRETAQKIKEQERQLEAFTNAVRQATDSAYDAILGKFSASDITARFDTAISVLEQIASQRGVR